MASWRRCVLVGALVTLSACEDPEPQEPDDGPRALVETDAWARVADPGADVFGAERPADAICDEILGLSIETLDSKPTFEINTDACNYATVAQPTLAGVAPGDTIALRLWHYDLTAPMPAQAHLGLALDGEVEWEQTLEIPADPSFVEAEIAVDRELPAGSEIQLHVHNHGANSYDIVSIEAIPASMQEP